MRYKGLAEQLREISAQVRDLAGANATNHETSAAIGVAQAAADLDACDNEAIEREKQQETEKA